MKGEHIVLTVVLGSMFYFLLGIAALVCGGNTMNILLVALGVLITIFSIVQVVIVVAKSSNLSPRSKKLFIILNFIPALIVDLTEDWL